MDLPEHEQARPEQARLDAISDALAHVVKAQRELDARLERIEVAMGLTPAAVTPPPLPEVVPDPVPPPLPVPQILPPPLPQAETLVEPETSMETRFGLGWLNRVAVVTLLFGVGFLFKYAVDNEWIGPGARVALGLAAATLALAVGEWISLRGQKIFAQGMTGLGLALLYLSFYASFGFYHLLPQDVAFLLMFLTTVGSAALAKHYDSQAVAILGLVGGFLTPALLATGENRLGVLAVYTLILTVGAIAMARLKRWSALEYVAFAGSWLMFEGWSNSFLGNETRRGAFAWLTATFVLFFAGSALGNRLVLSALNAGAYFATAYYVLDPQYHSGLGSLAGALALLYGVTAWILRERDARFGQLSAAIAAVFLTLAIPLQFTSLRITILWSIEAAALAWIAQVEGRPRVQSAAWWLFAAVLLRLFSDAQVFETMFWNGRLLTFAIAAASLWAASRFACTHHARVVTYGTGHMVLWWALDMELGSWALRNAAPRDAANIASTGMSILLAAYGLGLIVWGVAARSALNRILGLGLLGLVIGKLYLFDVWELSRGFRITAFLALGGLLLLVSYLYSRFRPAIEKLWKPQPAAENPSL